MGLRDTVFQTYKPEMNVPFTLSEYQDRLTRLRKKMEENNIDLVYCTCPATLFYLTGYQSEWYQDEENLDNMPVGGVAVRRDAEKIMYFDRWGHEPLTHSYVLANDVDIRIHSFKVLEETGMSELEFIMKNLKEEGWLNGTVGLEKQSHRPNPLISEMMQHAIAAENSTVVNASELILDLRSVKSPAEIAYHRTAGKIADIGINAARKVLRPGVTEMDVKAEVLYAMTKAGGECTAIPMPVLSGVRTTMAHALTSRRMIMPADMVLIDICGVFNRYHTNTVRPFCAGEPHPDVREQVRKSSEAMALLAEFIKPGMTVREMNGKIRAYYKETGLWEDRRWCGGYDIGAAFAPSWLGTWTYTIDESDDDERVLVPGTVMQHESQIYLPRQAGLSLIIDTIAFEEEGASILSDIPPDLIVCE